MRYHWVPVLLGAAVMCSALPAQAARHNAGKVSLVDLPARTLSLPGAPALFADADDCVEETAGALRGDLLLAFNGPARGAGKAPPTMKDYEPARQKNGKAAPAAAPAPASAPLAPPPIVKWDIRPGDKTLNGAMARWAQNAGWQLVWEVPVDYAVEAETSIHGSFENAIETVTKSMETAEIPLKAIFYKGNSVIRIVVKGAE